MAQLTHLNHHLCPAIGIRGPEGADFGDGDHVFKARCVAVDGRAAAKDNLLDVPLVHGFEQRHGAADVDAVVLEWVSHRLADALERGKVYDRVNLAVMLGKDGVERGGVGDVALVKGGGGALGRRGAEEVDAGKDGLGGVCETVDDDHGVAGLEEAEGGEGPNVSSTAGPRSAE